MTIQQLQFKRDLYSKMLSLEEELEFLRWEGAEIEDLYNRTCKITESLYQELLEEETKQAQKN